MVARMMMSAKTAFEPEKPRFGVAIVPEASHPPRMTPAREKVLDVARDGNIRTKAALAQAAGCSSGVVDGLVQSGNLVECAIPEKRFPKPNPSHVTVEFSDAQQVAVHSCARRRRAGILPSRCLTVSRAQAKPRCTTRLSPPPSTPAARS